MSPSPAPTAPAYPEKIDAAGRNFVSELAVEEILAEDPASYADSVLSRLQDEVTRRQELLADGGYASITEQREAVRSRNVLKLLAAGGNVYYLAKLAGIFGLNVQDIGAQQTGMSVDAFKAKLEAAGR